VLKTRVVAVLVVKDGIVVQSIGFGRYLPVGVPSIAVEYLNRWGIDEIVLLDIHATPENRRPGSELIAIYSRHAQVPFAVGGGIRDDHDIDRIIRSGADKVVVNTAAVENPALITEGARRYGNQCIVVSIDAREVSPGRYEAFTRSGRQGTGHTPADLARLAEEHGAGEILLTSIDRDGSKRGYDAELVTPVVNAVRIPVIVCGGVGGPQDLLEGVRLGASAVAAANFFHYTEHSVAVAKRFLRSMGAEVRLDTVVAYDGFGFDPAGRLARASDTTLDRLRFEHIPEEVI
jgi:cyclase